MRVVTESILGVPLWTGVHLNLRERETLKRAADLLERLDELAMQLDPEVWEDHPERADLVLGEAAMRHLLDRGSQHVRSER